MLIVNEVIGDVRRERKGCLIFKVDFEKMYYFLD